MNHRLSYSVKLARLLVALAALARPCIALTAAYALALQILLLSVTAASMAMTPPSTDALIICFNGGNPDGDNPQPLHSPKAFADCTLSCAQGLGAAAILPPDIAPIFLSLAGRPVEPALAAAFVLWQQPSPKLAQGPPQNA